MNPLTLSRQRHGILVDCLAQRAQPLARSNHFTLYGIDPTSPSPVGPDDIIVVHDFTLAQIDNNIGCYVANELLPLFIGLRPTSHTVDDYAYSEQDIFERYVGEIVRSMDGNERRAWHLYYDNTLAALQQASLGQSPDRKQDFISDFGAIYHRVIELILEQPCSTLLDVATCFGFLPLLIATQPRNRRGNLSTIAGCDLNPALVALANDYARQRRLAEAHFIRTDILAADISREVSPMAPAFDIVTAIHLLEHLEQDQTETAVANLWQLTRKRLIIAVPFESVADVRFGHLQIFDRNRLLALGRLTGGNCRYFEYHGGWIVCDRIHEH